MRAGSMMHGSPLCLVCTASCDKKNFGETIQPGQLKMVMECTAVSIGLFLLLLFIFCCSQPVSFLLDERVTQRNPQTMIPHPMVDMRWILV